MNLQKVGIQLLTHTYLITFFYSICLKLAYFFINTFHHFQIFKSANFQITTVFPKLIHGFSYLFYHKINLFLSSKPAD